MGGSRVPSLAVVTVVSMVQLVVPLGRCSMVTVSSAMPAAVAPLLEAAGELDGAAVKDAGWAGGQGEGGGCGQTGGDRGRGVRGLAGAVGLVAATVKV